VICCSSEPFEPTIQTSDFPSRAPNSIRLVTHYSLAEAQKGNALRAISGDLGGRRRGVRRQGGVLGLIQGQGAGLTGVVFTQKSLRKYAARHWISQGVMLCQCWATFT
jgi:hypothetical protein